MRRSLLIFGLLSLAAVWLAPLPQIGRQTFWAHMTMHMVVVAVAAPLLALGVAGGKFDPVPKAPKLFVPIPASIVELIAVWAWHAPVLHHAARHSTAGFVAEQATFLLTGLVMWLSAFGGDSASAGSRRAAGVIGLLLTSMHMTLLGALLALAPRPLFHHAEGHSTLTPLEDQHLGGAIMLLVGGISYLAGGLWLTLSLMRGSALKAGEKNMIGRWFKTAITGFHGRLSLRERTFFRGAKDDKLAGRSRLMRWMLPITTLLVVLGVGGLLVAASGIIPINASSGHWAITRWFLQFSKQRSVATHTLGLKPPPLDEQWLVLKGAGHYEIGCRPCHGSPELHHPRIAQRMEPPPPYLPQTISQWKPEELFYMVKHGIKFTGMPAWPSPQRDDEVWAMVAFLLAFPELDAKQYRQLVNGEAPASEEAVSLTALEPGVASASVTKSCAPCHGADGRGREVAAFPKLAGQRPAYFAASLAAYARGERHSGIMEPIAAGLSSEQIRELASHYESLKPRPSSPTSQHAAQSIERGQAIAQRGIPNQDVPACADCHGPSETPRNPNYPLLAGQHADYLTLQLTLFQQQQRGGTAYAHLMRRVAAGMNSEQMRDVAHYYASRLNSPRRDRGPE